MEAIGVVIRAPSPWRFAMRVFAGFDVEVGAYVKVHVDGSVVIGRVVNTRRRSLVTDVKLVAQLDDEETVKAITEALGISSALWFTEASVEVVGEAVGRRLVRPRRPPRPMDLVYPADEEVSRLIEPEGPSIEIGEVASLGAPARLDANKLVTQHCAILAATGGGKSWLAGLIAERLLLETNTPVVVIDPHGEYSSMQVPVDPMGEEVSRRVKIYVPAHADVEAVDELFRRRFGRDRLYERVGVKATAMPLRVLEKVLDALYGLTDAQRRILEEGWVPGAEYADVDDLVESVLERGRHAAPPGYAGEMALSGLAARLRTLIGGSPVFLRGYMDEHGGEPIRELDPARFWEPAIHVVDLSTMDIVDQQLMVAALVNAVYREAMRRRRPIMLIIEEAHNYAPSGDSAISKPYIAKAAREGRKFGLGLCIVSQRPSRVDPDVLSQAMTQIFKRIINPADLGYVARIAEQLGDPRQLKYLSEDEALIVGVAVRIPMLVKVGRRVTAHGGVSPSIESNMGVMRVMPSDG